VVADYKAPSSINKKVKSADPVIQYWRKAGVKDPTSTLGKKKALGSSIVGFSKHLSDEDYVRYFNPASNDQTRLITRDLIHYLQKTNGGVRVISLKPQFIESQQANAVDKHHKLYLIGIKDEIFLDALGTPLETLGVPYTVATKDYPDASDYIFSTDTIKDVSKEKAQTRPIDPNSGCAGTFCTFLYDKGLN